MKEIKAFIRPNKVTEIITQLKNVGFANITISDAEGTGNFQDDNAFVSLKYSVTDSKMAKLEMVVEDSDVDRIVQILSEYGKTLHPGDGIIYVSNVAEVYRVKTGSKID